MAQVRLSIGGRSYELACREGEEEHYVALAARIDTKAQAVRSAVGGVSETRQLLLAALLLADELDSRDAPPKPAIDREVIGLLESFAERLEMLGHKLENEGRAA